MAENPFGPWRDASLILLAVEAFVLGLVPVGLLYLANRGVRWLVVHARPVFAALHGKSQAVQRFVRTAMHKVAWPFVAWQSAAAGAQHAWRKLRSGPSSPPGAALSPNYARKSEG